jgi:hypothetical protein
MGLGRLPMNAVFCGAKRRKNQQARQAPRVVRLQSCSEISALQK